MARASEDFMKLRSGYLFPEVARRIRAWQERNPGASVLRLSIGNTTEPITPHIAAAMRDEIDRLTRRESYTGYGDEQGDTALREALSIHYREECGVELPSSAFFISDGAKSDAANIQSIFSHSSIPAVQDPAYPVYVDSNVAGGHTGGYDEESEGYSGIVLMDADASNGFIASPPKAHADIIYLCFPNNPTGAAATKAQLKAFVDFFDSAYSDYISTPGIPRSIYQIEGAEDCAIEIGSFSKNAGFTGVRLGWTIVPESLKADGAEPGLIHRLWNRRQCTFFNGASNIAQAGGIAALSPEAYDSLVAELYRRELARALPEATAHAEAVTGMRASRWSLRRMKSRWGSCTPKTRAIRINTNLAAYPRFCLDMVVTHELVHLMEPSHNARFHALLDRFCPANRELSRLLRHPA